MKTLPKIGQFSINIPKTFGLDDTSYTIHTLLSNLISLNFSYTPTEDIKLYIILTAASIERA